ncbi:MAG: hypothetical protein ACLRMJ_01665 [Alistipes finegoldii]
MENCDCRQRQYDLIVGRPDSVARRDRSRRRIPIVSGGKGANQAVAVARLGGDVFVARIGTDLSEMN